MEEVQANTMSNIKRTKGQTLIYKTLHRKLKMEQHELHKQNDVPYPLVTQKIKDKAT